MKQKLKNKFRLTSEVDKQIKEICKSLHAFQRRDKNGELMFRTVTKFKGTENFQKKSNGGLKYRTVLDKIKEPIMVNHYMNLTEIYQKDGQTGIDTYVKFFEDLQKNESKN